jgi:tetratricopeptide (TPR) repeat protein
VAKINPVKLKQDADKAERAGKFQDAIGFLNQLVDDNPRDWNTIKKIGDLYARLNRSREACDQYAKVADFYAKDGFLLKSIAIWKQIQKLDPAALEPSVNLADLYSKQGLMMEAKSQYQTVVDEYIKRGKTREAGDALRRLADLDPSDLKVRSKLADLYMREGSKDKALDEHVAIAEELTKKGHLNEALQVLEKGLKIDSRNVRMRGEIARIHVVQRNFEKATQVLEEVVREAPRDPQLLFRLGEAYVGGKKLVEAESIFKRLLEIDPNDQDSRVQMGRVCLLQGDPDSAFEHFQPVVEKLLGRKESDKAITLLQQIAQQRPNHIPTLAKLADVYKVLKKEILLAQAYSQLTEAYTQAGQFDRAAGVLEILVAMEPENGQYRSKLEFVRGRMGTAAPIAAGEDEELDFEAEPPVGAPSPPAFSAPPADVRPMAVEAPQAPPPSLVRPSVELSGALTDEDKEFIDEHLAEGKVFRKYGLVDKAADQFEAVIARFPDHVEARVELRDVYKEKGHKDKAAEQCHALAEIHRLTGESAAAEAFDAEARELSPGTTVAPSAAARPAPPTATTPEVEALEEAPEITLSDSEAPIEVEEDIAFDVEEEVTEVEEGGIVAGPAAEELASLELGLEDEGGALSQQFVEEEALTVEAAPAPAPAEPEISLAAETEEVAFIEPEPAAPPPPAPPPAAPPSPPPKTGAPELPADLQKVLGEVEEYVSLGFVDDARDALREILGRYPNHPAILSKTQSLGLSLEEPAPEPAPDVRRIEAEARPVEPALAEAGPLEAELVPEASFADLTPAAPPGALPSDGGLDLGAELDNLFGAQAAVEEVAAPAETSALGDAGLEEIFKEFKKGVDKQLGKEDYDTRYNLGIAYKEMGLIDEAIAEFQLAAKDEGRLLECASMLGICFMEKGMPKLAMKWFEKGLETPNRRDEEYQALRYDLAVAHEAAGDTQVALSLYTELYGQDANFRDVATKLRELRAALR